MSVQVAKLVTGIKKQPLVLLAIVLAVVLTGVFIYSTQRQANLQNQKKAAQAKLALQIDQGKKLEEQQKQNLAANAAAQKAAADKVAADAADAAAAKKAAQISSSSISLSSSALVSSDGKTKIPVSWKAGFTSANGFKLVWSNSPNPTYPGSDYQYLSEAASSGSGYVKASSGTYYIRVCEYLGDGVCGRYSNQVTVNVP